MTVKPSNAFTLVEVVLALGLTTFCLLTLFALLPVGLQTHLAAATCTSSALIVSGIDADLRVTQKTSRAVSPRYGLHIPNPGEPGSTANQPETIFLLEDGSPSAMENAQYRISLWYTPSETAIQKGATIVRLLVSWPASNTATSAGNGFNSSFETVIALDRSE